MPVFVVIKSVLQRKTTERGAGIFTFWEAKRRNCAMAYQKRRNSRYRGRTAGRRGAEQSDSFAAVTIVQILITLCLISTLYFSTLSNGNIAEYIRGGAEEALNAQWDTDKVVDVLAEDINNIRDAAEGLLPVWATPANEGDSGDSYGEAIFAQTPKENVPIEPGWLLMNGNNAGNEQDTPAEEPVADVPDESEPPEEEEEEPLGMGGMLLMDEGAFTPPMGVTTAPVYLSVKLATPSAGKVTSPFGFRTHPITKNWDFHTGIDIAAAKGTDILSALQGVVSEVGTSSIYGKYIILDHGGNIKTSYNHCNSIVAREGQRVSMGDRIATVGSTGISTAPHLHFELIVDGLKTDPLQHLRTAVVV